MDDVFKSVGWGVSIAEVSRRGVGGGAAAAVGLDCRDVIAQIGPTEGLENEALVYFLTSVATPQLKGTAEVC